jgi:1-acyl-sn-glycerol-3-phosphate acyltransferase
MGSPFRSLIRLALYLSWTGLAIPVQMVALALRLRFAVRWPMIYHRACTRLLGFEVVVRGERSHAKSTLFLANHSSYVDIMVLGSLIPGSFVAKSEVAGWPLFGLLAKLQRTVFVDRRARLVAGQRDEMARRLARGDNLILFPEGTSGDGNRILPFKSALLSVAELEVDSAPIPVQPVSVAYTHLDGIPLGRHLRPFYAWYGDMDLASHMWQMAGLGLMRVTVEFHPPVTLAALGSRKALARYAQGAVAAGLATALAGRPQPTPEAALPPPAAAA